MTSMTNTILDSLEGWYGDQYQEALNRSLARVHQHAAERSIGLISANRAANSPEENQRARHELTKDIRAAGYGFAHVRGIGQEEGGAVSEPSMLVIGNKGDDKGKLKKDLVRLGQKHGQFAVLHKQHGDPNAKLVYTSLEWRGKREEDIGRFHANNSAAKYFTALKGKRQFSFETVLYLEPKGFFVRRDMLYT